MMLKNIKIKNLKSFSEQSIELSNLTVFSGLNSSGKSTIINSILFPMQLDGEDRVFLNGEYFSIGTFRDIFHQWANDDDLSIEYQIDDYMNKITTQFNESIGDFDHINCECIGDFNNFRKQIRYISAERISPKIYFKGDTPDNKDFIGVKGELCVSVLSSLKNMNIPINAMRHEKSQNYTASASSLLANVNSWLDSISPNVTINPELLSKIRISTLSFGYENESRMSSVGSMNVGFGLTYILPVIVAGLLSKPGDILIIENPEAHLHPAGQRHIGEFLSLLASNGVQVIIETHSDHIINGIRLSIKNKTIKKSDSVFIFVRKEAITEDSIMKIQTCIDYIDISDEGKIISAPQGFFDEWEEVLYKLL
ncbi:TPA: AAA family ATPase [Enterobacter cloacae]